MIAASKRCGPPQTFSHTLKSKYFAVSKWREAQTYEVSQPTFDSINSPASLLCQFTSCFVCTMQFDIYIILLSLNYCLSI